MPTAPASGSSWRYANPVIAGYATYAFADQADVLVNARLAADAVGATKMDRPEWCAVHPVTGEIYYTLTNNSNRVVDAAGGTAGGRRRQPARLHRRHRAAASQPGNVNGHIIRMREAGGETGRRRPSRGTSTCSARSRTPTRLNGQPVGADRRPGLLQPRRPLVQPQHRAVLDPDRRRRLHRRHQLHDARRRARPGRRRREDDAELHARPTAARSTVDTYVGKKPVADTLKRFLVGPVDCEITGCTETPDGKALFVEHPAPGRDADHAPRTSPTPANYPSHWPGNAGYGAGGATARPRSATIAITKNDGGRIGT